MYSKVRLRTEPVHPTLVGFPIALCLAVLTGYVAYAVTGDPFWFQFGLLCSLVGVITAIAARIPGLLDWIPGIPRDGHANSASAWPTVLNVLALLLFAVDALIVSSAWTTTLSTDMALAMGLALAGLIFTGAASWVGASPSTKRLAIADGHRAAIMEIVRRRNAAESWRSHRAA